MSGNGMPQALSHGSESSEQGARNKFIQCLSNEMNVLESALNKKPTREEYIHLLDRALGMRGRFRRVPVEHQD